MEQKEITSFYEKDQFAKFIGVEVLDYEPGYCKTRLCIEQRHLNAANVIQGGAIFTLADMAMAVASNSRGQIALAINASITYLKGISEGTIYAIATEVSDPKRIAAYDVIIVDDNEEIIAKFNGIVYRKKAKV